MCRCMTFNSEKCKECIEPPVEPFNSERRVLSVLDPCGDESPTNYAGPQKEESSRITGDSELLRILGRKVKLADHIKMVPLAILKANTGWSSKLTQEVVLQLWLIMLENIHVLLCGNSNRNIQSVQSTYNTWRPLKQCMVAPGTVVGGTPFNEVSAFNEV